MQSALIRFLAVSAIFLVVNAYSYFSGVSNTEAKFKAAQVIQARENADRLNEAMIKSEQQTREHYERYIQILKSRHPLPDKCQLSADFRRMHDEATGSMPEGSTAQPVTPQAVADTVGENYLNCTQNAIWLNECNKICK